MRLLARKISQIVRPEIVLPEACEGQALPLVIEMDPDEYSANVVAYFACRGLEAGKVINVDSKVLRKRNMSQLAVNQVAEVATLALNGICARCNLCPLNQAPDDLSGLPGTRRLDTPPQPS